MKLTEAIDAYLAFVDARPNEMTRADVDELDRLGDTVYDLAHAAGLLASLPQVPELRPELESQDPPLPPVQFVTKVKLPGDWEPATVELPTDHDPSPIADGPLAGLVPLPELLPSTYPLFGDDLPPPVVPGCFLVAAPPQSRWRADMATLRRLAEAHGEGDKPTLLERVLAELTAQQRVIFGHLWKQSGKVKTASFGVLRGLRGAFNEDDPTDQGVEKKLKDIRTRINEAHLSREVGTIVISVAAGGRVTIRPPKG